MHDTDLYPLTVQVSDLQPGDTIYLGALIPFRLARVGEGFGRTTILTGRIPADHPLHGQGSEVTLELESEHQVVVYRPLDTVLDEARARSDQAWTELMGALDTEPTP